MVFRASAPGKTILMGEHAAVYGRPALVTAIDRRVVATFRPHPAAGVRLMLPALDLDEATDWPSLATYAAERRRSWELYAAAPDPRLFAELRGDDRAHVVKTALGEAIAAWGAPAHGGELHLESELPVGSGFGSSAACAAAVLEVMAAVRGRAPSADAMIALSLEVERRQHGSASGIDNAAVVHGGLLWAQRGENGLAIEKLQAPAADALFARLEVYHTGEPAEATGAVVSAVRALRERDPGSFERRLDAMAAATRRLRTALEGLPSAATVGALFREFQRGLEEFGVVPRPVAVAVAAFEAAGGAAKISGAGSLAGPGAGALLALAGDSGDRSALAAFSRLPLRLGAPGLRREPADPAADKNDPGALRGRG